MYERVCHFKMPTEEMDGDGGSEIHLYLAAYRFMRQRVRVEFVNDSSGIIKNG